MREDSPNPIPKLDPGILNFLATKLATSKGIEAPLACSPRLGSGATGVVTPAWTSCGDVGVSSPCVGAVGVSIMFPSPGISDSILRTR